ncbi:MBL fold metallo-hydrolase [Nocardia inohanensis]|uniref:MBL fold metallo-hydrolase n=1 Tax=Nocardia inohanensis TaxID=209246 RepID=UPI001FE0643D|nr:MBL fold metallo-hydrolase [Nocardia inohanensis]
MNRRSLLAGIGGVAAVLGVAACGSSSTESRTTSGSSTGAALPGSTKLGLVLLGTRAGPYVQGDRTGISSALVVDGRVYLVDCGQSSVWQYHRAGLKFAVLKNIFVTHLHSDHVADYNNFFMLGGSTDTSTTDGVSPPIQVYGPGSAGGLPVAFGTANPAVAQPDNPAPGLAELTRRCNEAFAYSDNVLMRDTGLQDTGAIAEVHEIALPAIGASYTNTAPATAPFPVMSDDRVRVTATLVPHGPVFPSFAFRFETEYGAVTFSGDTTNSDNLVELARGSQILVHEAINTEGGNLSAAAQSHMTESHTAVQQVGTIAERADVATLVLSHIADFGPTATVDADRWTQWAQQGYGGRVIVGSDLQTISIR